MGAPKKALCEAETTKEGWGQARQKVKRMGGREEGRKRGTRIINIKEKVMRQAEEAQRNRQVCRTRGAAVTLGDSIKEFKFKKHVSSMEINTVREN